MIDGRLSWLQIGLLVAYAAGMTGGQILFKAAALRAAAAGGADRVFALTANVYFLIAVALYAGFAVLWVWILTFTPLSRAYPFAALAFAITPLLGAWLFAEPLGLRYFAGLATLLLGLAILAG